MNAFISNTAAHPVPVTNFGESFSIGAYDYEAINYVGVTNNIDTLVYKTGGASGTTVATLTFEYAGGGAADDDTLISITQS